MKQLFGSALVLLAACGSNGGSLPDGGANSTVAASLSGLLWSMPCGGPASGNVCSAASTADVSATLGGTTGQLFDITVQLRGVVEQRAYPTACADGMAVIGGSTPDPSDTFNIYELDISNPVQTIYVNPGVSNIYNTFPIDYPLTFAAAAGATVTLHADSVNAAEISNVDANGTPISITGTSVTQPFDGQFIEMTVDSVVVDPNATPVSCT